MASSPHLPTPASGAAAPAALPDVLAALSHALDLTEGQAPGHSMRTCVIGMRFADELGLDLPSRFALYYALLLKDAGCSSNAAMMSATFGSDDRVVKPRLKRVDWHRPVRLAVATARTVGLGRPLRERVALFTGIARRANVTREIIRIRCDRGAAVARQLGFPDATGATIAALDEHWNGGGHPLGLRGDEIPLLARIANLAQVAEVAHHERDVGAAMSVAGDREGRWFDPRLVTMLRGWRSDAAWWKGVRAADVTTVTALAVDLTTRAVGTVPVAPAVAPQGLDAVARAFADVIDAKSPYTFRHSAGVSHFATIVAEELGLPEATCVDLRRAGLLHDIGKLGVSNRILDKDGPLTPVERLAVERHAAHTWEILSRVQAFSRFARMASLHHERLDGTGYPWRVRGDELDVPARVLAVADVYEALTADRPYRTGLPPSAALSIIARERGTRLCPIVVDALAARIARLAPPLAPGAPGAPGVAHSPIASSRSHSGQFPLSSKKSS